MCWQLTIDSLPDLELLIVLCFRTSRELQVRARAVRRRWRALALHEVLCQSRTFKDDLCEDR